MAKKCVKTGKTYNNANIRSKALNATKRKQRPNLQFKKGIGLVSTKWIKTQNKIHRKKKDKV